MRCFRPLPSSTRSLAVTAILFGACGTPVAAQTTSSGGNGSEEAKETSAATATYSPDVVAKAKTILDEVGLRRSGVTLQSTKTADISRAMTELGRERRELRLIQRDWKQAADREMALRRELRQRKQQDAALNLQLARLNPSDVRVHNKIVAQINANRAATELRRDEREKFRQVLDQKRARLNDAESEYAETVLAIRQDLTALRDELSDALTDRRVRIALHVMATNHGTPTEATADSILAPVERRLKRIEQEVFRDSIPLTAEPNGSLTVPVAVAGKTVEMVVDSGSTLVSLPAETARNLGVTVPPDAPPVTLVLADGRTIPARGVTLDRVRVGQFEAEDVAAAVLDKTAIRAEPLLGMSFLRHFKFEIDAAEKSLKMLRVAADSPR